MKDAKTSSPADLVRQMDNAMAEKGFAKISRVQKYI
jgi:hypothetical protein